jgi:flagellar FliL protein
VAEDNAAAKASGGGEPGGSGGKPILLYILVFLNMAVVAGVGAMLHLGRKKDAEAAKVVEKVATGMVEDAKDGNAKKEDENFIGKMIPLEVFLVNLSGNRGNKLLKVSMELEVEGERIAEEIDKRKPQIRDIIIILLSSKTYAQVSAPEGKEFLRDEIRDTVNSFLTKGKIKRVHFTEFVQN